MSAAHRSDCGFTEQQQVFSCVHVQQFADVKTFIDFRLQELMKIFIQPFTKYLYLSSKLRMCTPFRSNLILTAQD